MIYLAAPYHHKNAEVTVDRIEKISKYVANNLIKEIFSPVIYFHSLIKYSDTLEADNKFWNQFCVHMLMKCRNVVVLQLDGWEEDEDIKKDIEFATRFGLPIKYVKYE